jgi:hypothetical protein
MASTFRLPRITEQTKPDRWEWSRQSSSAYELLRCRPWFLFVSPGDIDMGELNLYTDGNNR